MIFLVRHADFSGHSPNPNLSDYGKQQSINLANKIKKSFKTGVVTVWTSPANCAKETAEIIKYQMQIKDMIIEEKLWSDKNHSYDFYWLKQKLCAFEGEILIIISHLEYVRQFPASGLGFYFNEAGFAEGVLITNGKCLNF